MHFASANHSQGREHFQPIELQYSVLATWWKYREPSMKIHFCVDINIHNHNLILANQLIVHLGDPLCLERK